MVGEMRDLETISLAITASETGHLVLGTLHTSSAARTLDRVLDVFPVDQRDQIRIMVSESLRGIVSQQLVPRADGKGRVAGAGGADQPAGGRQRHPRGQDVHAARASSRPGRKQGMKLMDESLRELCAAGIITAEEALARADQKQTMKAMLGLLEPAEERTASRSTARLFFLSPLMAYIDQFFEVLVEAKASDLHIREGEPPHIRLHGEMTPIRPEPITNEEATT